VLGCTGPRSWRVAVGVYRSCHITVLRFDLMLSVLTTLSVITSWYGPGFHGRLTANGERFNQHNLTAAHPSLPFGTRLKVCFKRCAVVRVNDRGPYHGNRGLDLSKAAADRIGLTNSGVGRVQVTRLS
jgi:rare lipoprotein A